MDSAVSRGRNGDGATLRSGSDAGRAAPPRQILQNGPVRVQIWSYNYEPEPQGIGPLSGMLAQHLQTRGHDVLVVAAHPHYPEPYWGVRLRPYREKRHGIPVLRLPLWPGRTSGLTRIRQELAFSISQTIVAPILPPADVLVAVTPSFPAVAPAMGFARLRRIPWVMWVQDITTEGAVTTGQLSEGPLVAAARRFERLSYKSAHKIVVISDAFRQSLITKGVPSHKIRTVFNPSTRFADAPNEIDALSQGPPQLLAMGNIGHSQGLDEVVEAFERNSRLAGLGARLVVAGAGVAQAETAARIRTDRVSMLGVLHGDELTPHLRSTLIGLVTQSRRHHRIQPSIQAHELHGVRDTGDRVGESQFGDRTAGGRIWSRLGIGRSASGPVRRAGRRCGARHAGAQSRQSGRVRVRQTRVRTQ